MVSCRVLDIVWRSPTDLFTLLSSGHVMLWRVDGIINRGTDDGACPQWIATFRIPSGDQPTCVTECVARGVVFVGTTRGAVVAFRMPVVSTLTGTEHNCVRVCSGIKCATRYTGSERQFTRRQCEMSVGGMFRHSQMRIVSPCRHRICSNPWHICDLLSLPL